MTKYCQLVLFRIRETVLTLQSQGFGYLEATDSDASSTLDQDCDGAVPQRRANGLEAIDAHPRSHGCNWQSRSLFVR